LSDISMLPVEPASSADEPETVIDTTAIEGDNSFTFHCTIDDVRDFSCTFQCQVNNQGFVPCESPKNYGTLRPDEYTFEVYAVNSIGKYDHTPASFEWVVASETPTQSPPYQGGEEEGVSDSGGGENATSTPAQ